MGAEASVVGLAYIERLVAVGGIDIDENTWQRITLTALLLAHKMWDDDCLENVQFAEACHIDVVDLNLLEQAFMSAIGFNLSLSAAEYARYYFALRSICQLSSSHFPLRRLDEELEGKLALANHSFAATIEASLAHVRRWEEMQGSELSRSV